MNLRKIFHIVSGGGLALLLAGCALGTAIIPMDRDSALPGTTVIARGEQQRLTGTPLKVGMALPATALIDASTMQKTDLAGMKGSVLLLSLVPSIDTKVCETQTHYLEEHGTRLQSGIKRITISRDTPFAQMRFAKEAKLTGVTFLSDYKAGIFGHDTGLLLEDNMLLARAVILVDRDGIVRYIQVVPNLAHLPDMEAAFTKAEELAGKPGNK